MLRAIATSLFLLLAWLVPAVGIPASAERGDHPSYAAPKKCIGKYATAPAKLITEAGPGAGQATLRWKSDGKNTDYFRLGTSLVPAPAESKIWNKKAVRISPKDAKVKRGVYRYTLSAALTKKLGAGLGTGHYLHVRLWAVNEVGTTKCERRYPPLASVGIGGLAPDGHGPAIRIGSWNLRLDVTPGLADEDARHPWGVRAPLIANQIKKSAPGVAGLQALLPRMIPDLKNELRGSGYRFTREGSYDSGPGSSRILYDSSAYETVHDCSTANGPNCKLQLEGNVPIPVAKLRNIATQQEFWVATAHLTVGQQNEGLRERQATEIAEWAAAVRASEPGIPVIFTGDVNTHQRSPQGGLPHKALVRHGFYDSGHAVTTRNLAYSSVNHYKSPEKKDPLGFGPRLDVIMMRGMLGAQRFEIVLSQGGKNNALYPSDHNFIYADLKLP